MLKKRLTGEQIVFAARQADGGAPAGEVCRKMGVAEGLSIAGKGSMPGSAARY